MCAEEVGEFSVGNSRNVLSVSGFGVEGIVIVRVPFAEAMLGAGVALR